MTIQRRGIAGLAIMGIIATACGIAPAPVVTQGAFRPNPSQGQETATFDAQGFSKIELMVALKKGQNVNELKAMGSKLGYKVSKYWPQINSAVIHLDRFGGTTKSLSTELQKAKSVAAAQPAGKFVFETTNDPQAPAQYGMKLMNVEQAWTVEPGNAATVIAFIDTGVDTKHPDLKDKLVKGYNSVNPSAGVDDEQGHGTHTAGIAAAAVNNGVGVIGVGGKCSIMMIKALGGGESNIADGVIWAADHGANVLSMSIGLYKRSPVFERALQYALDKGVTLVGSAGNNNAENDPVKAPHLPSTHPGCIEVAATDSADKKASFSNFGKTVTVAAPGVDVLSTTMGGTYGKMSGTSMACPHVAGLAGLILSKHKGWSPAQVKKTIEASAKDFGAPGFDPIFGFGRADAFAAVQL